MLGRLLSLPAFLLLGLLAGCGDDAAAADEALEQVPTEAEAEAEAATAITPENAAAALEELEQEIESDLEGDG